MFDLGFEKISHKYLTKFSKLNYQRPKLEFSRSTFRMSNIGPSIWNNFLTFDEKQTESFSLFKSKVKSRIFYFDDEKEFF